MPQHSVRKRRTRSTVDSSVQEAVPDNKAALRTHGVQVTANAPKMQVHTAVEGDRGTKPKTDRHSETPSVSLRRGPVLPCLIKALCISAEYGANVDRQDRR
jgi:hypothetical protein